MLSVASSLGSSQVPRPPLACAVPGSSPLRPPSRISLLPLALSPSAPPLRFSVPSVWCSHSPAKWSVRCVHISRSSAHPLTPKWCVRCVFISPSGAHPLLPNRAQDVFVSLLLRLASLLSSPRLLPLAPTPSRLSVSSVWRSPSPAKWSVRCVLNFLSLRLALTLSCQMEHEMCSYFSFSALRLLSSPPPSRALSSTPLSLAPLGLLCLALALSYQMEREMCSYPSIWRSPSCQMEREMCSYFSFSALRLPPLLSSPLLSSPLLSSSLSRPLPLHLSPLHPSVSFSALRLPLPSPPPPPSPCTPSPLLEWTMCSYLVRPPFAPPLPCASLPSPPLLPPSC